MTKLTKTQQTLIANARHYGSSFAVETGCGRGGRGGRVSYGAREIAALHGLVAAGLACIIGRDRDWDYNNGYSVLRVSVRYEIVEPQAGPTDDQFLAALGPCGK